MDEMLINAWRSAAPPFDGATARPADLLPLVYLSSALRSLVEALHRRHGNATLLRLDDWHEHDGYVTSSRPITWQELVAITATPEALYEQRPGDDHVRLAVYESTGRFMLRIWIPDEDDDLDMYPGRWGDFDLTASESYLQEIMAATSVGALSISPATRYFEKRFAG